jgi:hypothetical protein
MLELREKEILKLLERIKEFNFVLIGGYAINSYTQPRFSVDCDIVVPNHEEANKVKALLIKEGFEIKSVNPNIPYAGSFLCLMKQFDGFVVPIDILIGNVIDRNTKLKFSFDLVYENSEKRILMGKASPAKIELRIAKPGILIIMKLAASRTSDYRDVFMLFEKDIEQGSILTQIKQYRLEQNFSKFKEFVSGKGFKDNLHGVFGKVDEKIFMKILNKITKVEIK